MEVTRSLTTVLEGQLRKEIKILKTEITQLRTNDDAIKESIWSSSEHYPKIPMTIKPSSTLLRVISDLGVATVMRSDSKKSLTKTPSTADFMPPGAQLDMPVYDTPLNVFSYGEVVLHTDTQLWLTPSESKQYDPKIRKVKGFTKVEQCQSYIDQMRGNAEELVPIVVECLDDLGVRPSMIDVSERLKRLKDRSLDVNMNPMSLLQQDDEASQQEYHFQGIETQTAVTGKTIESSSINNFNNDHCDITSAEVWKLLSKASFSESLNTDENETTMFMSSLINNKDDVISGSVDNVVTVLTENFAALCNDAMTDINGLLKYFVAQNIITLNEVEEIGALTTKSDQELLLNMSFPLKAGGLLVHGTNATQCLAEKIIRELLVKENTMKENYIQIMHIMLTACNAKHSFPLRYVKVSFYGATTAGKSSFPNLLMTEDFHLLHISTGVHKPQKVKGAILFTDDDIVEFEKMHIDGKILQLKSCLQEIAVQPKTDCKGENSDDVTENGMIFNYMKQEVTTKWRLMDTGGQPQFISMLTVNSFSMTTLIHIIMQKFVNKIVQVQYGNKKGEISFTSHQTIETLISYASNILLPDTEVEIEDIRSILLVGPDENLPESDLKVIDNELTKQVEKLGVNMHCQTLVPVNNKIQGRNSKSEVVTEDTKRYTKLLEIYSIQKFLNNLDVICVPLHRLLLKICIVCEERKCNVISYSNGLKEKKLDYGECANDGDIDADQFIKEAGMQELVITSHHWLFNKVVEFLFTCDTREEIKGSRKGNTCLDISNDFKVSQCDTGSIDDTFLKLLESLQIATPLNQIADKYYMPCLLNYIDLTDIELTTSTTCCLSSSLAKQDGIVLTVFDMPTVKLSIMKPVMSDWKHLGVQLLEEYNAPKLNIIEKNNSKNTEPSCREKLKYCFEELNRIWDKLTNALIQTLDTSYFIQNFQQAFDLASDSTNKNVSSNTVSHHCNGIYCPECRKTVCMCTVKDHFLGEAEDDSAYKSKANVSVKVDGMLGSFVIFNVVLLQLLLSYNHLTPLAYMNALQSTNFLCMDFFPSGYNGGIKNATITEADSLVMAKIWMTLVIIDQKVANFYQKNYISNKKEPHMATSSLFSDNEIQDDNQPSKNTNLLTICVALILFFSILLSIIHDDIESIDLQPTDNLLQDAKYKNFCKHAKQYFSECLANSKSLSGEIFVTNTEIQGCVNIQGIGVLENSSSCKVCCRNIVEEIANQLVEVTGGINLLCNKFGHRNLAPVLFLQVASDACKKIKLKRHATMYVCNQVKLERYAKEFICKQGCGADDFSTLASILSNLQLFVDKTLLSLQINFNWNGSSQKLLNIKESIFTKEFIGFPSIRQLEYLLPESNVVIQSDSQHKSCLVPEATSDDKWFIAKCHLVTLQVLPELTFVMFNNGDVNTGFMHVENSYVKSVGHFVEKYKAFSEVGCQESKLCNTALYKDYDGLQLIGLCSYLVKPNLKENVFVIEMIKDINDSVCHNIPLLMIDLGRCLDLTPEIMALLSFNAALVEIENFYSHLNGENFYMSHLQSYSVGTTKAKRNRSFRGTHTKLVISKTVELLQSIVTGLTSISKTVELLQSVVTGLTPTVHCHSFSDVMYAVFRPLGKPNINQQSVGKSMNQQKSFTSYGDRHDAGGSVSSTNDHEHIAGKQEDMLQSSTATKSNDQPLQITPESYQMSASNDDTELQEDTVEKDGHSPLPSRNKNVSVDMLSASTFKQDVAKKDGKSSTIGIEKDGKSSMMSGMESRNQDLLESKYNDVMPVGKDHVGADSLASNQQSFTNPTSHEKLASQRNLRDIGDAANNYNKDKRLDIQQCNPATKERDRPLDIQPESYHMGASNANVHSSRKEKNVDERDGHSPLHIQNNQKVVSNLVENVVEKDGKLSMASGADQAMPLSSIPTAHKLMIGNVTPKSLGSVGHNSLGAQLIKGLSRETEVLPTVGPHLDALYNTHFEQEVQSSREEVRHKGNARTTFYQHEVEQRAYNPTKIGEFNSTTTNPPINDRPQVKPPEVKVETGKGANDFKPKPLPKRSCIVCGNKQYPLSNNLVSLPHMDHYFVKERKEIRPSHYLAKLVLRHQYQNRDDMNEETPAITAAQQSQAAVLAADSAVEKDGAVTERKHFPMNLNRPGFVVFSSDLTRFTGSIKYPLPSRKATAVKLGKGGNGFVFAIFHNGKEYAVKKTVYRPNEIRVHSQLAHSNLVNLDAVLVGEEHEKHKGKFYAFCFMTKCDMDFRSVISTKDHGCLKHLKLQLSDQRDVWQLVMVNVKYVLRSVLKALDYMHAQGLVHRDVKASNILLKMQCNCSKPLMCACPQKYLVKLGDFDSSTTVPGHGLRIEPHQMIRYASVLPLGTMGYRAPEVSMHLVIAGPYEVLYTTAVDIWSFGCLLLNMLIGKCGPLKQRGEASLLLSMQEQPYSESLYMQIIKIKELQKYYGNMPEMVDLVRKCLQVKVHCRPSAKQLLQLDILQCV